ncbi:MULTISPECIES: phosphate signaling complex protein PhoU [Thalassospira]|jgi:phosphate transport system protein|uniref:Phosphate-specific transport system accessory protein PhoU n=1 Tax=Thalassospira mesophila TaxID=1293891 RepID=A0A1Y2L4J1_9PROT|nr:MULTISPECIES: phosphate signaling complex protein PhoU [Thalassospira]OSQ40735.1 PhoU family transcriptional regulator [Thalassospira mesophila]OSQ46302.1 PhoU family transcriptional regulator [Thalassospira sp. MCCC 1A01428]
MRKEESHIVSSFDDELTRLNNIISQMGGLAESQLISAIRAISKRDSELAEQVIVSDLRIDKLEQEVQDFAVRVLALRQPMADDLRQVVTALKLSNDLERIGDLAKNIAKRAQVLNQMAPIRPVQVIPNMARLAQEIIKDVLDAYIENDAEKAQRVWARDQEVDDMYNSLFRELLTYMMEDPRNITASTHLLFIAKNIERIGDHATNIAETIYYRIKGEDLPVDGRPKNDAANFAVIEPNEAGE